MTMNALITTISMFAAIIGVTGNIPQLVTMFRKRSSAGQSIVGWSLSFTANFGLAFVNGLGYHAMLLAIGNVLSFTTCLIAVGLVWLYRRPAPASPSAPRPQAAHAVTEMHTQEFVVLRDAVLAEHHRRTGEQQLALA